MVGLADLSVEVLDTGVVAPAGVTVVPGKVVFEDGFASGNASAWSGAVGF